MEFARKDRYGIEDLLEIVRILRQPGGCPWDREQTHASIRKNLIEETYEVADAIDRADEQLLCEELGDLMLQVALHAQMEQESGGFTFGDVCDGICQKLIFRHPHVFGPVDGTLSPAQVLRNWEALKNDEKGRETAADRLGSVPPSLPALMYAQKVQKRAADFGFAYPDLAGALADLDSEADELEAAVAASEAGDVANEVGDVLFSAVNVARMAGVDAEEALSASCQKFVRRLVRCEELAAESGKALKDATNAECDAFWKRAKAEQQAGRGPKIARQPQTDGKTD